MSFLITQDCFLYFHFYFNWVFLCRNKKWYTNEIITQNQSTNSLKVLHIMSVCMQVSVTGFYRMDYPFFHVRIWCIERLQNGSHNVECRTCLHTCILWAGSMVRASHILTAVVYQSAPPIHVPLVLVLPRVCRLSQAVGMPYAPERLLGGCGLWSQCL